MKRYQWASSGDVNAFFGLMLDNVADLILAVSLLSGVFGLPATFALRYMVPGTALGVVCGGLAFSWMAFRLARRTGRSEVTAMPLGLDTPSTFGMEFFVLGPAFLDSGLDTDAAAAFALFFDFSGQVCRSNGSDIPGAWAAHYLLVQQGRCRARHY